MDIRIEKTERAIRNAFLELRAAKPLEKITVKELCSLACINKSTFYSHYEDIYALSQMLESETITTVIKNISSQQESPFKDPDVFTRNLYMALVSNHSLINILFSDYHHYSCAGKGYSCGFHTYLTVKYKGENYDDNHYYALDQESVVFNSLCLVKLSYRFDSLNVSRKLASINKSHYDDKDNYRNNSNNSGICYKV